jgi:hypothetical protein
MNPYGVGPIYEKFLFFAPIWTLATIFIWVVASMAASVVFKWQQIRVDRWVRWSFDPIRHRRDWMWIAGLVVLLLACTDLGGFEHGFFRFDDFAMVNDARGRQDLLKYLNLYHNDHLLPLFRAQVALILEVAGPTADANRLASYFNLLSAITFFSVLLAGCWLLSVVRACRLTLILFCLFIWTWPSWGEFTAGFYTILIYPQTVALGFFGLASIVRALEDNSISQFGIALASAASAALVDASGIWVAVVILTACILWKSRVSLRCRLGFTAGLLAIVILLVSYHTIWAVHLLSERELVQNPAGSFVRAGVFENALHFWWRMPLDLVSGVGGVVLSSGVPPVCELLARKCIEYNLVWICVLALEVLIVGLVARWLAREWHSFSTSDVRTLIVLLFAIVISVSLIVVARASTFHLPGTFWPAKYKCVAFSWLALGSAFVLDRVVLSQSGDRERMLRRATVGVCLWFWLIFSFYQFERILDLNQPWIPGGRYHGVVTAKYRRADFFSLNRELQALSKSLERREVAVPEPNADGAAFPYLEYGRHATLGANYSFGDLVSPNSLSEQVALKIVALKDVSSRTLKEVQRSPKLRVLFQLDLGEEH